MLRRCLLLLLTMNLGLPAVEVAAQAASGTPMPAAVDAAALQGDADDGRDWLSFGHGYANQRFSPLEEIDRTNVKRLVPRWIYQSGRPGAFQAQPLVADGKMYVTLPGNDLVCLDAATGEEHWRYRHEPRFESPRVRGSNRGAALGHGRVYQATNDGRLIALDMESGTLLWDRVISRPVPAELVGLDDEDALSLAKNSDALAAKMPPLVVGDQVIVGVSTAGYGIYYQLGRGVREGPAPAPETYRGRRGYLLAVDAATGEERWRWHTTRSEGWTGEYSATTPDGFALPRNVESERTLALQWPHAGARGGSSTWMTPAYDPALGLLFLGTGNAAPNDVPALRPGDNLYANSLVALDVRTGQLNWHYQQVPHDLWGYDVASTVVLFDIERKGKRIPGVGVAGKTGWFYAHDRRNGQLLFKSPPLVPQQQMFSTPTIEGITIAPGSFGGASWSPVSYDPRNGWIFVPAVHKPTRYQMRLAKGADGRPVEFIVTDPDPTADSWGTLSAVDTRQNGKIAWQVTTDAPLIGGVLATAGHLVFMGEGDGRFKAYDSETGGELWSYQCGAGVNGPPVSYQVGDRQFVAVPAGGHPYLGFPAGDALIAFGLVD